MIGSVLSRAVIHTGLRPKPLLRKVTGKKVSNFSFFLPSQLGRLAALMGIEARELLWKHTVFPYVVAFMSAQEVARLQEKVLSDTATGCLSSLIKSVTKSLPCLRYCVRCASDDEATYGESYWHREHCLPAVRVCLVHDLPLFSSSIQASAASRSYGEGLPQHQIGTSEIVDVPPAALQSLARLSHVALRRSSGHKADWEVRYRKLAVARGFALGNDILASAQLARDISNFYGPSFLEGLGCSFDKPTKAWPSLMVRERTAVPFSPARHVLLQAFLLQCQRGPKALSNKPPGKKPRGYEALDAHVATQVRIAIRQARVRRVRTTVTALLRGTGYWSAFRHGRSKFPLTVAELNLFRQSEASERKVGGRAAHRRRMERRRALTSASDVACSASGRLSATTQD